MDYELHIKYKDVNLTPELRKMFADVVNSDTTLKKTLFTIGQHTLKKEDHFGITIKEITERVVLERRKMIGKSKKYEIVKTNIDRKSAERTVDRLLSMGLCYYRSVPPSKVINITTRGKEVLAELKKLLKGEDIDVKGGE
ncbi:putative transcriptional regulator [Evansella vedderi]|uniref:Transcriptional regulator n=1 Tax=Evansella vedderi TaxID=38282 RepID=A0ABT9ZW83_9BACI|nr:hypothetical protein [Evansella vedderi]MDQ0255498.1 putative transcriptional regulator [Evansella vedderi]